MARIQTYIQDDNITDDDIVLGSDGDDNSKTKNYTVGGLKQYIGGNPLTSEIDQDNIVRNRRIFLPVDNALPVVNAVRNHINNLDPALVVNPKDIYFFHTITNNTYYVLAFNALGKGTYGAGETQTAFGNYQIISERSLSSESIEEDSTTDTVNLGNIDPLNVSEAVNNINPPITIQNLDEGFTIFKTIESGENKSYLFQGDSGLTGNGEHQTTLDDFLEVSESTSLQPATATPPASGTFEIDLSNYLSTDYSGSTTSLTDLAVASGAVQAGNARVKGNWSTKPTFTGATEINNSTFVADTDIYLYVEKWADGVIYWYSLD